MYCYVHFNLVKGRSLGFASVHTNYYRPCQTRFRFGSNTQYLNLASMKQLVGSLCKRHAVAPCEAPTACKRTVSGSLSLPCSGSFSPFPHGTGPLSVFWEYLALRVGPRDFRQDSSCPALLRMTLPCNNFTNTGLSPSPVILSRIFSFFCYSDIVVL